MKKNDTIIISQLRTNGRIQITDLARKTGLPVSTIHDKIKRHVQSKIIKPTVLLNFEKMGFLTRAHILLSVDQMEKEKLFHYLKNSPHVNSLFRINNGWNVFMECIFKDMHSLEDFVEKIESTFHVRQKEIHYVLDELKREEFLAQPEMAEAIMKPNN